MPSRQVKVELVFEGSKGLKVECIEVDQSQLQSWVGVGERLRERGRVSESRMYSRCFVVGKSSFAVVMRI